MKNKFLYLIPFTLSLASELPAENCKTKAFVSADFLYWQTKPDGQALAISSDSALITQGDVIQQASDWNPGFRIGLGVKLPTTCWELAAQYTFFNNHADRYIGPKEGRFLFPLWPTASSLDTTGYVDTVKGHFRLHFGMIDMALRYPWKISPYFSLSPFFGIKIASVRQKDNMIFTGGTLFPDAEDEVRMKNKFLGAGPLAGLRIELTPIEHLRLIGSSAYSLAFGKIYLHQDDYATIGASRRLRVYNVYDNTKAFLESSIGVEGFFNVAKSYHLNVGLCWDVINLWEQDELMHFSVSNSPGVFVQNQGDLTIQGLSLRFLFEF